MSDPENSIGSHLLPVLQRIDDAEAVHAPPPWSDPIYRPVGGLTSVGFAPGTELLLVVSADGRGVFDGATGERLARDYDDDYPEWHDPYLLEAEGIGPLEGQQIRLSGLYGGGLPQTTRDGWSLELFGHHWPSPTILLVPPNADVYGMTGEPILFHKFAAPITELRAVGFSSTGRTLVIATASDLTFYHRSSDR